MGRRIGLYIETELDGHYRIVHERGRNESIRIIVMKIKDKKEAERTRNSLLREGRYG